ncbi:hypothetical protein PR048_011094 [Dryococelus australis]|uniref:Uncharacterized protein n=1 Tax=Dryococelus australis TaxID=614101 RepID=A0ABQ9HKN0_9NEOP|nr:hypothetical protein PR048_011094 [Dryococelus australis]
MKLEIKINQEEFCQFINDNADFNSQTTDGYKTFHVMGGMYTVAPATAVPADKKIPRLTENLINEFPTSENVSPCKGTIGYIIEGSDLTDLFNTIYTTNSIEKIMSGHAYYRAVRAHFLAHAVVMKIVMEMIGLTSETYAKLDEILYNLDKSVILASAPDECSEIREMEYQLQQLKQLVLWPSYGYSTYPLVTLVKIFILSKRMGNWDKHLQTVCQMLPYFHASGHFAYAKCVQDMLNLKQTMHIEENEKFTIQGFFTIRLSTRFWCGTWMDMTTEKYLMKNSKAVSHAAVE